LSQFQNPVGFGTGFRRKLLIAYTLSVYGEVFPKHQFWENNLRFRGKKRASDRFFQSLSQANRILGKTPAYAIFSRSKKLFQKTEILEQSRFVRNPQFPNKSDEEKPMFKRKLSCLIIVLVLWASSLGAGDIASFVDLGFSPDGRTYMFAQYGVQSETLKPWADLFVVDVPRNDFVSGGKISYTHTAPVIPGQDGSGALYRLIAQNRALAEQYGINFLFQGYPLYISLENNFDTPTETIEFRNFEQNISYHATLVPHTEETGTAFYINLERINQDGSKKTYVAGNAGIKRALISSYGIKKVITSPQDGFLVFVIAMKKPNKGSFDVHYMVETLRL
jgi:predicted secreted protein